jgi:hypothetical protein
VKGGRNHPEGDALYHSLQVFELARCEAPWDRDLAAAALLHDVGKAIDRRDHVIAEAFHGGNCLFEHRPPYIAVRTRRFKYLWKEYRDPTDAFSAEGPELFDHRDDPLEQNNLYRPDHPELPALERAVAARLAGIPEIPDDRIVAAFGDLGREAVNIIRKKTATA